MFDKVSTALITLLQSLTKIQNFYNFEATNLEGFPALTLTPSANENAYATSTENRRVYAFVIRLYVERGSGNDAERQAERTLREMVDNVLDRLDKNYGLSGVTIESQTGYTFLFMEAIPSRWGYAGRENQMRVAEINVRLHFDIDINQIS